MKTAIPTHSLPSTFPVIYPMPASLIKEGWIQGIRHSTEVQFGGIVGQRILAWHVAQVLVKPPASGSRDFLSSNTASEKCIRGHILFPADLDMTH